MDPLLILLIVLAVVTLVIVAIRRLRRRGHVVATGPVAKDAAP